MSTRKRKRHRHLSPAALELVAGRFRVLSDAVRLRLLQALQDTGLADDTRVIYTSDHGDNLGNRGFWGKSVMYEEAAAVPLIMAGDDIPRNHVVQTPVSLVDLYPTFLEALGERPEADDDRPGRSLFELARRRSAGSTA